jgi:hypothetical protein
MKASQLRRDIALKLRDMTPTRRERFTENCGKLAAQNRLADFRLRLGRRVGPAPTFPGMALR